MSGYCVILSGRLPGNRTDAPVWGPVIAAFELDQVRFVLRVVAVLPVIVRQNLDEAASREQRVVPLTQFDDRAAAAFAPTASPPLATSVPEQSGIATVHAARRPSFDCAKPVSPTEVMICADSALSELDAQMARTHCQVLRHATAENAQALKPARRGWLGERAQRCVADKDCIGRSLRVRIQTLKQPPQIASSRKGRELNQLMQGQLNAAN